MPEPTNNQHNKMNMPVENHGHIRFFNGEEARILPARVVNHPRFVRALTLGEGDLDEIADELMRLPQPNF